MTAQTLPDDLDYCFCPAYGPAGEPQQIHIVVDGLSGYIPTALLALSLRDALRICDRLNARLGFSHQEWTALAARSMRAEAHVPGGGTVH